MEPPPTLALDWEKRYREGTTPWERSDLSPAFLSWRAEGALTPCRILVPGAGRSAEPAALAEAGFDVTVVDAAASAVGLQKERLGERGQVIEADLFAWEPARPFDAVYDQTCLCAVPPSLWPSYAARLHRWLRPGGKLFVLFMQTKREGGPPYHCEPAAMHQLFGPNEWIWPEILPVPVQHPLGLEEQPAVLVRI